MAEEIQISGGPETAKIRSVWAPALLPFVTFFIYHFVWYYKINREMADLGRKRGVQGLGDSPGKSLLAITLGALVFFPAVISIFNTYKRLKLSQNVVGVHQGDQINGWIMLALYLVLSPAAYAYEQDALNKVWAIDSGRREAGVPQPVAAAYTPVPVEPAASAAVADPPAADSGPAGDDAT